MTVFEPKVFLDPHKKFRPLKIIHGLDRYLGEGGEKIGLSDRDPAGQWDRQVVEHDVTLTEEQLSGIRHYLRMLASLGVGGIVTNVGFQDYLESPLQWEILRQGLKIAKELGLRVWLYDEKGYPSGTAAGKVTRANPEFAASGLACYPLKISGPRMLHFPMPMSCRSAMGAYATQTPESATTANGIDLSMQIDDWGVLHWDVPKGEWTVMYFADRVMYEGTHSQGNVSEFKQYVNLLDPAATKAFLRVTHEVYHRELPPDQWATVEAIFTDEPSFMCYYVPALPERYLGKVPVGDSPRFKDRPMAVPWTQNFNAIFRERYGYSLKPHFYALFYSQSEEACYVRQQYYEVLTELYAQSFYEQIQDWCHAHGIASSGHLLLEENILDHVIFHGSLFEAIRRMDLPGLDMLSSQPVEMIHGGSFMGDSFMGVKQVSSIAHVSGHERVHSESSDWEQRNQGGFATLQQRRGQANVQYVLGVNQITSYFGWQELGVEAQRKYNDYVGRLGSLLTEGRHICDVAVLYPVRTLWTHFVPPLHPIESWVDRTTRSSWEDVVPRNYSAVVKELLCNQIDTDIIDERALTEGCIKATNLCVADEVYRVLVCSSIDALSLDAARVIERFAASGGIVICTGALPRFAESAQNATQLQKVVSALFGDEGRGYHIPLEALVATIKSNIKLDFELANHNPHVLYTHRILEGRHVYFMINNQAEPLTLHPVLAQHGPYTLYRPLTGDVMALSMKSALSLSFDAFEGLFLVCKA